MTKTELLQIIEQAAEEGWTELDLSNQGLTELPPEIGGLINLKKINIENNKLNSLPAEIGSLINLEILRLGRNQLSILPYDFRKLASLKELTFTSNKFVEFPDEILELSNLKKLYFCDNRLISLPSEISKLTQFTHLFLDGNQLSTLPPEVGDLANLKNLNLMANRLSKLPLEIEKLLSLEYLRLNGNPLPIPFELLTSGNKPDEIITYYHQHHINQKKILDSENWHDGVSETAIQQLIEYTSQNEKKFLVLSHRKLTNFPLEISNLTDLTVLDLSYNNLTTLPQEIEKLTKLKNLDLRHNQFTIFPSALANLTNLTKIHLGGNQLTTLPSNIGNLKNLKVFRLWYNGLTLFPKEICMLKNLIDLNLSYNQITELPKEINELTNLEILSLEGNPLPIPPEILKLRREPKKILNYYFQHVEKPRKPLNEAKVLIVGQGAVGKTSLIKRLLEDKFDPHETKTDGIAIKHWHLDIDDTPIRLNLWDFGGQEIMHATHQFFLTKRSLYVLVLDSRVDEQENRLEYWLKIIQSFGGDSPVIVVCNKSDQHDLDLDWKGLQTKYPTIKAFAKNVSCKIGEGLAKLKTLIEREVAQLEHIHDELILSWFAVKTKLEEMERDYISYGDYQQMCQQEEVNDDLSQQTLLGFLHDLGIVLHFHDHPLLEDTNVLNPEWITRGVYQLLNSNELFQSKGELDRKALERILDPQAYPRSKHQFIIDMMRKFELCFDFAEFPGQRFLVPDLLAKEEPYTGEWADSLAFQYFYDILPGSVISRFMVRMHAYIHQRTYWRNGVVLVSEDSKNRALVKADIEDKKIFIYVSGKPEIRHIFLEIIRADFRKIHKTIPKLAVKEKVPIPGYPDVVVDYEHLLTLEELGEETFIPEGLRKKVSVKALLHGIGGARQDEESGDQWDALRLAQKRDGLQQEWETLGQKLLELRKDKILETRPEEKLRIERTIEKLEAEQQQVEHRLHDLESIEESRG